MHDYMRLGASLYVPATRPDVARIYGKLLTEAYEKWLAAGKDGKPNTEDDVWQN